jgi:hypothetical protein
MSTLATNWVTGPVITDAPFIPRRVHPPRPRPVHFTGSRCRHAHAWSTDPLAVTCGACHRTRRWLTAWVTRLLARSTNPLNGR